MKIYLVTRMQGSYDERSETIICAYWDEGMAKTHAEKAGQRALQLRNAGITYIGDYGNVLDPTLYRATDLHYGVESVELEDCVSEQKDKPLPFCEICLTKIVDGTVFTLDNGHIDDYDEWLACCEECGESHVKKAKELAQRWTKINIPTYTNLFICYSNDSSFRDKLNKSGI